MSNFSPQDWKRVEALFDEALDRPATEREAWVRERCAQDHRLRDELLALLAAEAASARRFEVPVAEGAPELVAEGLRDPLVGRAVGPYRVVEEVGRGGMGVVYAATREDGQFQQDVVVKVLRAGMHEEEVRRRFLLERQILADLDHPNIARLLDGGVIEDGRPYFVMEHVRGLPIDVYCDSQRLNIRERLELFAGVIDAVDFAHRNLVVHRDLKPSNVLVTGDGQVKLLDFGIAKLLDRGDELLTLTGNLAMTPEYASPEQVLRGPITTVSDVYQLGVLLYEVLVGRLPYGVRGRSPLEISRTICEEEPTSPSRAITEHAGRADPSDARRTSMPRLRRELRGDLERILLMALRKEPDRRYASAHELGEDLRRYLDGDPVRARPDGVGYRAGKFVRRHWVGVSAAAILLLATIGFGVFHTFRMAREREVAQREASQRREISDFLVDLFRVSGGADVSGEEITTRELLERGMERVSRNVDSEDARARLLEVMARIQENLGLIEPAMDSLREALTLYERTEGEQSESARRVLLRGADLHRLDRDFEAAREVLEEVGRRQRAVGEVPLRERAWTLRSSAITHRETGESERALEEVRQAHGLLSEVLPEDDPTILGLRGQIAFVLRGLGEYDEAEMIYRDLLPRYRAQIPVDEEGLSSMLNNFGFLLRKKGAVKEAATLYEEGLDLCERARGAAHPQTLLFRQNLASVYHLSGRSEQALEQLRAIRHAHEQTLPPTHWKIGSSHLFEGKLLLQLGEVESARRSFENATGILREGLGSEHMWTAHAELWLALAFDLQGESEPAAQLLAHASPLLRTGRAVNYEQLPVSLPLILEEYRRRELDGRVRFYEEWIAEREAAEPQTASSER